MAMKVVIKPPFFHSNSFTSSLSCCLSTSTSSISMETKFISLGHRTRPDFPILHQEVNGHNLVYLDNGATSQKPTAVLDALKCYYEACNANVHRGIHFLSAKATDEYELARKKVAVFVNAREWDEIVFTRNATEAINLVANSWGLSNIKAGDEVVGGENAAVKVEGWISRAYVDRLRVEVVAAPEDKGTAGALRTLSRHLKASDIMVVSGDLVCDVPPGAVAAALRRHDAVATAMLCSTPVSGPTESASSSGKDKAKKPASSNLVGLDATKQFLLLIAAGTKVNKDMRVQKSILRAAGQMEIRTDLMDAHLYAFKRSVLQEVLDKNLKFTSLQQDLLPYLVRTQLQSDVLANATILAEENGNRVSITEKPSNAVPTLG